MHLEVPTNELQSSVELLAAKFDSSVAFARRQLTQGTGEVLLARLLLGHIHRCRLL